MTSIEEGVPMPVIADDKSDAGSATTAPSVESGDHYTMEEATAPKAANRRWMLVGGGVALLVVAGIITAAVLLGTSDKNKCSTKTSSVAAEESISLGGEDEAPPMFLPPESFAKPFGDIDLPIFQEDVLEAYETREALEEDLTLAAKDMINKVVLQNLKMSYEYAMDHGRPYAMEEIAVEAGASIASASAKQASQSKVKESMRMTNNQEEDVDEADVLKTDGTFVYASYGDYLVVWDLQGNMVTQQKMPAPVPAEETQESLMDDMFFDSFYSSGAYSYIESIQLTENHVLVIVGGMGEYSDDAIGYGDKGTHVRIYNKPTAAVPTLDLVATRDIHGYFFNSRYLESTNTIHLVTGGDFATYSSLVEPLDLYNFEELDQTGYYDMAVKLAKDELIPKFVTKVADFLINANSGEMPTLMKVNKWLTERQAIAKDDKVHAEDHFYGSYDEAFRAYVQVTSINVEDIPTEIAASDDTHVPVSTTALLGPSSWGFMYAAQDSVVLHMSRYEWNQETSHSEETLFVIHLKVADDATTTFHSLTTLPGYLPTTRSIDILGDDLRIATTHQKWTPLENVWPVCGDSWYMEDSCMNEENWNDCFEVALGCRNVVKAGCPYTFECADEAEAESSTDNFVYVFDISQPGMMQERGKVLIGEPHEVIMGVHFGETFSYANTFDQRDPFYVLKLEQGQAPSIAGELKLEGFSRYLQPINDDATLLVGIGQNVTGEGMEQAPNGVLVTVFDVSDPADPKAVASDMLANPTEVDSFTDAEWDDKAVQYRDGLLVIPLSLYQKHGGEWLNTPDVAMFDEDGMFLPENTMAPVEFDESKDFEGFVVLDVSDVAGQGIKEVTRINHAASKAGENCHYCNNVFSYRRSFLFDDKSLMTVHDSAVVSTDLTTGSQLWALNVTLAGEEMNCCY